MFDCKFCDRVFDSQLAVYGHKKIHASSIGSYICINCGKKKPKTSAVIGKYCSTVCRVEFQWENETKSRIMEGRVKSKSPSMKRFLIERDGYECSECGVSDWRGEELSLDIDHVDGNSVNNMPDNLRFLCPNCHRITKTWGNKKR